MADVTNVEKIIVNSTVTCITCDWDKQCEEDLFTHMGFRITEKGKTDTQHSPGFYSIHSPLYGSDFSDDAPFEDRFSCECGRIIGAAYRGAICPKCGKKVEFIDIDLRKTGWIVLDKDWVIQPEYYKKIQTIIGTKVADRIIKYKEIKERDPNVKYDGIGLIAFRENFDEIMNYYLAKHPTKWDQYVFVMSHKYMVFVKSIPVFSSHLRPFIVKADEIRYSDEDRIFRRLFTNSELLNDRYELDRKRELVRKRTSNTNRAKTVSDLRRDSILYAMQADINTLWDLSFDAVKKKTGQIRDKVLGGRLNFTARNVIVPSKKLRANEIELGYTTFLELYKLQIISLMEVMYDIPHTQVWDKWEKATVNFDEQVYKVMCHMISTGKTICQINRNPTINYGSQLVMKVIKVKPDINDLTMSLPESILRLLNADFDGDVLNIVMLAIDSIRDEYYKKLNPMTNVFISRNDGLYNDECGLYKDQAIELYTFVNI